MGARVSECAGVAWAPKQAGGRGGVQGVRACARRRSHVSVHACGLSGCVAVWLCGFVSEWLYGCVFFVAVSGSGEWRWVCGGLGDLGVSGCRVWVWG